MTITCISINSDSALQPIPARQPKSGDSAWLTTHDLQILTQHLEHCRSDDNPLLAGVLRWKIDIASTVYGDIPPDVATLGSHVTYMVTGGGAQRGRLVQHDSEDGAIPITSLLGATLIGMRELDRAPLPRVDGSTLTLALLRVAPTGES